MDDRHQPPVVRSAYDQWSIRALHGRRFGFLLLGLGAVVALMALRFPNIQFPATIFMLLGSHALTASQLCSVIARKQAALDMRRVMTGREHSPPRRVPAHLAAGDTLNIHDQSGALVATYEALTSCTLERTA